MAFPNSKQLKKIVTKLKNAEATYIVSKDAPLLNRIKFQFCQRFIVFMHDQKLNQVEMAKLLDIDKARINEIVKCRIELFSLDKLIRFAEKLKLNIKVIAG